MARVDIDIIAMHDDLPLPSYATEGSAGMDIYAAVDVTLRPHSWEKVVCGVCIALPVGFEAQIRPRSGLAAKFGVTVLNAPGTIDADYRGEIAVIMINHSERDFTISRGMRVAQMVVAPVVQGDLNVVATLSETARGAQGFGSTGLRGKFHAE